MTQFLARKNSHKNRFFATSSACVKNGRYETVVQNAITTARSDDLER